jgi:hypothetical protein
MFDANHEQTPNHQAPQIRYSTQSDPDYSFNGGVQRSGRPDGAFTGGASLPEARSFDLALPERIPPGYGVEILVTVKAPLAGVTGRVAYNSFVATANFYETNASQSVKTTTTFEPSKQKFILYTANDSVPSGGGIGGGETGGGENSSGENGGGTGNGEKDLVESRVEIPVVENVVVVGSVENPVAVPAGEIVSVETGGAGTTGSGSRGGGGKSGGNAEATISSSVQQPVTTSTSPAVTSPTVTSPAATSPAAASVSPDEPDADVIDDERTFSQESIEQFKPQGDGMSTRYKGLTMDDEAMLSAQSGNVFADLADGTVPTGNFLVKPVWSLLSLILSLIAVVISVLLIVGVLFRRGRKDSGEYAIGEYTEYPDYDETAASEEEKTRRKSRMAGALTVIFGALTLIVWRILDDLSQPMVWINQRTLIVVILFALQMMCLVIYRIRRVARDRESGDADYAVSAGWTENDPSVQ